MHREKYQPYQLLDLPVSFLCSQLTLVVECEARKVPTEERTSSLFTITIAPKFGGVYSEKAVVFSIIDFCMSFGIALSQF